MIRQGHLHPTKLDSRIRQTLQQHRRFPLELKERPGIVHRNNTVDIPAAGVECDTDLSELRRIESDHNLPALIGCAGPKCLGDLVCHGCRQGAAAPSLGHLSPVKADRAVRLPSLPSACQKNIRLVTRIIHGNFKVLLHLAKQPTGTHLPTQIPAMPCLPRP
jgi:hypothetical protein